MITINEFFSRLITPLFSTLWILQETLQSILDKIRQQRTLLQGLSNTWCQTNSSKRNNFAQKFVHMKYIKSGWSAGTTEIDPGKNSSKRRSKNIFVKLICQSFYLLVSYLTSYCAADVFSQVITLTILQWNPVNMNIKLKIKSLFKIW